MASNLLTAIVISFVYASVDADEADHCSSDRQINGTLLANV